jgi:hypothetical protein
MKAFFTPNTYTKNIQSASTTWDELIKKTYDQQIK